MQLFDGNHLAGQLVAYYDDTGTRSGERDCHARGGALATVQHTANGIEYADSFALGASDGEPPVGGEDLREVEVGRFYAVATLDVLVGEAFPIAVGQPGIEIATDGDGVYAINVDGVASDRTGDKFESGKHVYPFRSYLTTGSALSPNSMNAELTSEDYVLIADDIVKREKVLDGDISNDPDGGVTTESGLRVYALGKRIIVVSDYATTLPVHTISGALVRVLDVLPGTSTYSGFQQGVYVVDKKKIRLR